MVEISWQHFKLINDWPIQSVLDINCTRNGCGLGTQKGLLVVIVLWATFWLRFSGLQASSVSDDDPDPRTLVRFSGCYSKRLKFPNFPLKYTINTWWKLVKFSADYPKRANEDATPTYGPEALSTHSSESEWFEKDSQLILLLKVRVGTPLIWYSVKVYIKI